MFNVFWQVSYVRCWESGCARQHSSGLTSTAVPEVGKKKKKGRRIYSVDGKKLEIHIWDSFSYISLGATPQRQQSTVPLCFSPSARKHQRPGLQRSALRQRTQLQRSFVCVVPHVTKLSQGSPHGRHLQVHSLLHVLEIGPLWCHTGQQYPSQVSCDTCSPVLAPPTLLWALFFHFYFYERLKKTAIMTGC